MIAENTKQILLEKGNKYLKTLGSGGFRRVYLIREIISNNYFAIKYFKSVDRGKQSNILTPPIYFCSKVQQSIFKLFNNSKLSIDSVNECIRFESNGIYNSSQNMNPIPLEIIN